MAELICGECGMANDFGAEFCAYCHAFLAWDDPQPTGTPQGRPGGSSSLGAERAIETAVIPRVQVGRDGATGRRDPGATPAPREQDTTAGLFRAEAEQREVTVPATGEPVTLVVRVTNLSMIVDGYTIQPVSVPGWLTVEPDQIELLPDAVSELHVRLRTTSQGLVPAQVLQAVLRVTSLAQAPAHADLTVEVTVPVVDGQVQLRAEPRLLRVRDGDTATFTVHGDNSGSNRAVQLRLGGSDPELAVRFRFAPPVLELGPGASGSAQVTVTAPAPDPGTEVSRVLTVLGVDGTRSVETLVTVQQLTSAPVEDPPVELEAQPGLVRVRDTTVGMLRLTADNRGGRQWARLTLRATDPERAVRVTWSAPRLDVPPGETASVDVRLQAPLPAPGSEVSRTITVTADEGKRRTTTTATFVQVASASPMASLVVRTDPSVVRVQDADSATSQLVLDNRRGRTGVRISLEGVDPERAIAFAFSPSVVEVPPGRAVSVALRMDAWRPPPGQEVTRPFTVRASDGDVVVEAAGSLVQVSSRAAMETLAVQLDPTTLRLATAHRGGVTAMVDNRRGVQPVRVTLRGDDPENSLRFAFDPDVLDVAPGRLARSAVTIRAPGISGGRELNRPFTIAASDGQGEVVAEGTLVQTAAERRPLARILFTVLGALAMVLGAFLPFWGGVVEASSGAEATALDLNVDRVLQFFANAQLPSTGNRVLRSLIGRAGQLGSVGLVLIGLGVLAVFGLTGRSGRLTRVAAFLGLAFVVVVFVAFAVGGVNGNVGEGPGPGALLLGVGCVSAYVGGLLVRR